MAVSADVAPPAAPGAQWKANLVFIWLGVFVGLLGANFVFPFVPFYIRDLGETDEGRIALWTAVATSAAGLSLFVTAPLWGSLADRFGRKPMFLRALAGAGVLVFLMSLVDEVWQFVALRFAMGAFAGTMGAAAALVAATTPRAKVGPALGALQTAMFSANMLGPVLGGEVAQSLGIRESFVFCSLLFLSACLLAWMFVREDPIEPAPPGKRTESLLGNLRLVLRERQVVLMLGLLFCLWLSTTFVRPLLAISIDGFAAGGHVALHLGFTEIDLGEKRAASYVFAALGLTSVVAAIVIGRAGTAFGYKRCIVVAAIGTGGLFLPVAVAPNYTWFLLLFAATGVFQGAMVPGMNALIAANTPEGKQGSAFGLAASMQSAALMIGPLAGGAVTATLGIEWDYAIIGFILLIAATVAALWVRDVRPHQPTA